VKERVAVPVREGEGEEVAQVLNVCDAEGDSDPEALTAHLAAALNGRGLGYLHVMRADFFGRQHGDVLGEARRVFTGAIVANMGFTPDEAEQAVGSGAVDAVAFGTAFLANPDLPARIRAKAALNAPDAATFYSPGAKGYNDYPAMA
jgi:N-ethylmaleimide reductase